MLNLETVSLSSKPTVSAEGHDVGNRGDRRNAGNDVHVESDIDTVPRYGGRRRALTS